MVEKKKKSLNFEELPTAASSCTSSTIPTPHWPGTDPVGRDKEHEESIQNPQIQIQSSVRET